MIIFLSINSNVENNQNNQICVLKPTAVFNLKMRKFEERLSERMSKFYSKCCQLKGYQPLQQCHIIILQMTEDITFEQRLLSENHEEQHISVGQLLKSIIYGGVDGTVNTTIILLSGVSSNTPLSSLFAITIAAIVAGALDMACCDYVSAKAEIAYIKKEEDRELYEVRNMLEQEKAEIVEIYKKKGYSEQDCSRLAELYSTNQKAFVNIMMLEELNLVAINDEDFPLKCGLATLLSFSLFGFITASPYIVGYIDSSITINLQPFMLVISVLELISLGFAKSVILGINKLKSILEILLMGGIAMGVGYGMGVLFATDQ